MTAEKLSTLYMPRLEMVKVPPAISAGPSLPSLACTHTITSASNHVMHDKHRIAN